MYLLFFLSMNPVLNHIHGVLTRLKSAMQKDIIGQDELIEKLLITFFAGGHALLEGVPGLGKTKTIRTLAKVLGLDTKRVSFTPDLLPSDLTGNEIYRMGKWDFSVRKGPIFTSILLADEINRTPPKVQSALLEAMEEKKVTIADKTFDLPSPFVVFATQNPLEHEGTYPLPEAQLDRFLLKIILDYPSPEDERRIFEQETNREDIMSSEESAEILSPTDIEEMVAYITKNIRVDEKVYRYVSDLLSASRNLAKNTSPESEWVLSYWASTRAGLALIRAWRVRALLQNRDYILPEDIKHLAHSVLDHRIGVSYTAAADGVTAYQVIERVLQSVIIP